MIDIVIINPKVPAFDFADDFVFRQADPARCVFGMEATREEKLARMRRRAMARAMARVERGQRERDAREWGYRDLGGEA